MPTSTSGPNAPGPWPLASQPLAQSLLDLVFEPRLEPRDKKLKKSVNEVLKTLNRNNAALVVLAADTAPFEIVESVVAVCERQNVKWCFVQSKMALGRACGVKRCVVAACVVKGDKGKVGKMLSVVREEVEGLYVGDRR